MLRSYFQRRFCNTGRHTAPARGVNWGALVVRAQCRLCGAPIRVAKDEIWVPDPDAPRR